VPVLVCRLLLERKITKNDHEMSQSFIVNRSMLPIGAIP
jgi:hypothetical protein